jgi:hypothetical protein
MFAEREPLFGSAAPATAWPVFEDVAFDARRHDAEAEAFHVIIKGNICLLASFKCVNCPFRELRHCRHRVATAKASREGLRKHNMVLFVVMSMEKQA